MSRLLTDDMAPETLTDADFEPETDAPETLTDADFEPETDAPETLTEADFEPETDAPETLTEADMAEAAGTFHPDQLKTDWADVAPSFGQASAGAANVFRGSASAGFTLADKVMAAAGLPLRVAEGAAELAGMGPAGGKSRARADLEGLRERLAEWREKKLGQRNAEGKPTTEFWETIGGQAANAATEIFLMRGIGAGLGMIKAGTAAGKAAQAGKAGAAAGKAASVWQRLRPSSVTKLYLLSQAEATAGKAEDAGMGRAQQLALGAVTGTWEAAMESVSQIFGAQAAMSPEVRGGVARAIRRALADTLFEGSEEALQEGGTATVEKLAGLDERTWAQIAADAARAFTVGAVTGAAIGGANTAAEASMGRRVREQFGARLRAAETGGLGTAERRQVTEAGGLGPLARQAANIADLTQAEGRANEGELSGEAAQRPDVEAAQEAQGQPAASGSDGRAELPAGRQAADGELSLQERRDRATLVTADAPRRRFQRNVSDDMLENDPVRAHVILLGGVRPDGTEDQSGIPTVFLARKGHGQRLDQMLVELRGMGLEMVRDWTTDDLREHLLGKRSGYKPPARQKTAEYEAERDWYKSGSVAVFPSNLALGYTFTVRGQAYEVADADADGYILVPAGADADGYAMRLAAGGAMNIDKGSLRAPGGKAVKRLEEVADAATLEMFRRGERERDAAAREELALLGFPVDERAEEAGEAAEAGFRVQGSEDTAGLPTLADINTDDDAPFAPRPGQAVNVEGSPAPAAAAAVPAAPAAPAARGLTVIRRGYDAARTAADDPEYSRLARHPLDLPELVELAEDLMAGRTPRVVRQVNPAGWAAGSVRFGGERDAEGRQVYGRPTGMKLHKDNYRLVSAEEVAAWRAEAEAKYGPGEAAEAAVAETLRQETATRIKAGPRLAMKVIAHEIGHIADQMTRYGIPKLDRSKSANRLNLLGRVAGAIAHTRGIISADPAGKTLSPDEARVLAGQARRNARPDSQGRELFRAVANVWGEILQAHPEYEGAVSARELQHTLEVMRDTYPALSEWFQITTFQEQTRAVEDALRAFAEPGTQAREARRMGGAWFRQAFVAGLEARRQAHLKQMYSEMEALIAWWNGGERTMMDEYYKAPGEMFAEAFGVWLNNPGAVQKRAPMFYTTLVAYMDTRPEVQEWLREFDEMLDSGGDVRDRRIGRIRRFFSEDTRRQRRQVYDLARKKVKGRTASDMVAYIGWSKSSPLRAVLRQAERMGHKALADQGSEMADRIENLRGLEELYRAMNIEIGRVLDEGGLNVEDFDTYALLDMVARSPAYVDKAAPHGLHPEAARQTLARMREQMGDAAANTLARAVETSQQIWQSEIVAPLEQYGGYDPGLIKFMRENPIYFTLQVGMDDAELAEWNKALQSGDKEAVSAAAMRAIEHGLPGGQRVTGEIHARQGTHRPAMSLLGATMLKGEALLSAAMHNEAMRQGEELLKAVNDPMYAPIDENNKTARDTAMQVVLSYRVVAEDAEGTPRSKTVRYYAPRYVGHFLRGDNPINRGNRVLQGTKFYLTHRTLKLWQTMMSFRFIVTQPWADRKAWNTQMPGVRTPLGNIARGHLIGGLAQMIPAATWILPPSFFPRQSRERLMRPMRDLARAYYRTGKIDPKLRKLIERGMYDLGGAWQGVGQDNPHPGEVIGTSSPMQTTPKSFATFEAESGRAVKAMQKIGSLPVIRTIMRGFHWSQDAMYAETLANKLAGMAYLDEKYPDMPERQKREWVLKAAGNPNFASRSAADPFIDTFAWAFYNPAKEGFRSLAYSARHDPLGFAIRTSYYNLLPNLITKLAATGLLAEGLRRIMPHGDSPEDEEKRERFLAAFARWTSLFGRINSYYGRRHVAIPILPVGTDSALTITVPQAQSFAPINSLINTGIDTLFELGALDSSDDKAASRVTQSLARFTERGIQSVSDEIPGIPFLYGQSRGMVEQTVGPILTMMLEGNTNVYDPFYQRFILDRDEETLMRGGKYTRRALPAWSKLAKNAYNSAFGSMLGRFDTKTPRADNAAKTELQKIITAPGVGALIGGWIRITGGGESESLRELLAPESAEQAAMSILARQAAVEALNSSDGALPAWAGEMYATNPAFAKTYNRFRARAQAYSDLTPAQRMIYTKSNPKWKRQLILESELERQLRARE